MLLYGTEALDVAAELSRTYAEVFTAPPWNEVHHQGFDATAAEFDDRLHRDARRAGFRAAVARESDDGLLGFATGWTTPAPFRTDRAYPKAAALVGPDRLDALLVGALEVDELAVLPSARGTGLARSLLTELIADAPEQRAWLLTWTGAPDTVAFYRHLGWHQVEPAPGYHDEVVVFLSPRHPGAARN